MLTTLASPGLGSGSAAAPGPALPLPFRAAVRSGVLQPLCWVCSFFLGVKLEAWGPSQGLEQSCSGAAEAEEEQRGVLSLPFDLGQWL